MEGLSTALLSFLVAHPGVVWMALATLGVSGVIIWWQTKTKRRWQKRADERLEVLRRTQGELYEARESIGQLVAEKERHREQLAYWFKPGNCLEHHWAVVGVKKVRKSSGYGPDEVNEHQKHLGRKDNVFEPMPPLPTRLPATDIDCEPALVLTNNVGEGRFRVLVVRPADMEQFPYKVLAEVDIWLAGSGWGFDIPKSARGTGALSLALDYIVARAKKEEVPVLEAMLTYIRNEAHRIRLCNFYARKYGFTYRFSPTNSNGYITKKLK